MKNTEHKKEFYSWWYDVVALCKKIDVEGNTEEEKEVEKVKEVRI